MTAVIAIAHLLGGKFPSGNPSPELALFGNFIKAAQN